MPAPRLKVTLTPAADQTLLELRGAVGIPQRTKDRAEALRLNHRGWTTEQIAAYLGCQIATVRQTIHRWQDRGLYGLWDLPRKGRSPRWSAADIDYLVEKIETSPETFNSRQLAVELEEARSVKLSRRHLRRVLKKKGIDGNALGKAIGSNKTRSSDLENKLN